MENNNTPPSTSPREIIHVGYNRQVPAPKTASSITVVGAHPPVNLMGFSAATDSESDSEDIDTASTDAQLLGENT